METKCDIFVVKRLHFSNMLNCIWTWSLHLKKIWTVFRYGLSFKKSGLDLVRKIWQSAHLCDQGKPRAPRSTWRCWKHL